MKVKHLIFDVDNTLYPAESKMNKAIDRRMIEFASSFFHVTYGKAMNMRQEKLCCFASTLEWLMSEGMVDAEPYFAAIHPDNETADLTPDSRLRPFLLSLHIPMSVLTNAPREHAERVLEFFGVRDLFSVVTDIRDCGLKGKPYPIAFEIALKHIYGSVADSLFIDDQEKYTSGYAAIGGTAVHVGSGGEAYQSAVLPSIAKSCGKITKGKTFHLNSIYNLPDILPQLSL